MRQQMIYEINTSIEGLNIQDLVTSYNLNLTEISNETDPHSLANETAALREGNPDKVYNQNSTLEDFESALRESNVIKALELSDIPGKDKIIQNYKNFYQKIQERHL